ncbi:unnamed protein product [Closterium sp. Naga37s-1]|nr:unnamed protein product [Closterium sp. Naga37s-1]
MPGFVQGQGATTGAPESAAGHSGPAAVTSTSSPGQPVDAACITTVASGQPCVAESSLPPVAAQPGAPAGALPSAPGQPGASSGARAAGVGQPGAAVVMPASAGSQPGAILLAATGQACAAAGIPTATTGQTGAAACDPTVPTVQTRASAGIHTASTGCTGAAVGVPTAAAGQPGAAAVAPTTTQAQPGSTARDAMAYAGQQGPSSSATHDTGSGAAKKTTDVHHLSPPVPGGATVPHQGFGAPPASSVWATGLETRVQAAAGRPMNAAVVQPSNDAWDIGGPHTKHTIFHPGVLVQDAVRSEAADETARAAVVQTGSSAWSSGEQFFAPCAFPPGMHIQGAQPPCAVGYASHAGGDQPVPATSAVPSGPIGHALRPPNVLYLGSGQHHANVQLPLSSHRPLVHDSGAFLVADEALDNVSGLRGHTSASRGLALSGMLSGFVQGSQSVLPSPAASTSMPPSTQGGEHGEEAASRGFTGVTKKQGKDEWIARIVLDRSSQSLIVINSHFGSEVDAASVA